MKKMIAAGVSTLLIALCGCGAGAAAPQASLPLAESSSANSPAETENSKSSGESPNDSPQFAQRRVAYFSSWSAYARGLEVANMDAALLTHINFAFANLKNDGEIVVGDSWVDLEKPFGSDTWDGAADSRGHFGQLRKMKQDNPALKILISVGGWSWSANFSQVASSEQGRQRFAKSALDFIVKYGFDGLDIDWEFPVEGGNDIAHKPEDKQNYTLLVKETRKVFAEREAEDGKHYLLTIAGGPNPSFTKNTQLSQMMEDLDYINIMAYDYHGGWESVTGHNAPLYAEEGLSVSGTVEAYLEAGVPADRLNLGLAFYGRGWGDVTVGQSNGLGQPGKALTATGYGQGTWEGGCFDYWDIAQNYVGKNGYIRCFDDKAKVPYLYNGSVFISYDDEQSIGEKLSFAAQKGLGGVMFWEFAGDKEKVLQKLLAGNTQGQGSSPASSSAPKTSSVQESASSAAAWDSGKVYNKGDIAVYQGKRYQANWWTQGEAPSNEAWGPWTLLS